jgi:hypothetical protein
MILGRHESIKWASSPVGLHPEAHEGLEPARSIPRQEMSAPAAGTSLGGEMARSTMVGNRWRSLGSDRFELRIETDVFVRVGPNADLLPLAWELVMDGEIVASGEASSRKDTVAQARIWRQRQIDKAIAGRN